MVTKITPYFWTSGDTLTESWQSFRNEHIIIHIGAYVSKFS